MFQDKYVFAQLTALDKVLALTQGTPFDQWKNEEGYKLLKNLLVEILHRNNIVCERLKDNMRLPLLREIGVAMGLNGIPHTLESPRIQLSTQ